MKFSYSLIKKLGTKIPPKEKLVEALNLHAFETVDLPGDALDITVPSNRYSDAASHYGVAAVASAIFNKKAAAVKLPNLKPKVQSPKFGVAVSAKKACRRYSGLWVEVKKIEPSPKWLQEILLTCGLRSVNSVVDVLNYVMLELGQPLHVFDADAIAGGLEIRFAKSGERVKTLDENEYGLTQEDLVIADDKGILAIAGVKGGKRAEVSHQSRRLVIEAANFDAAHIYKTARSINLATDASQRFNHGLAPVLVERGIRRVAGLLKEVCRADLGDWVDWSESAVKKSKKQFLKFDVERFRHLSGLNLPLKICLGYLKNLGFSIKNGLIAVPPERTDVTVFEDLAEEVINLYGYDRLPAVPPRAALLPSGNEDQIILNDKIRRALVGFGFSEVYNYSFVARRGLMLTGDTKSWGALALKNPISDEFAYLRPSLVLRLLENVKNNLRFFEAVRIFEIGRVFKKEASGPKEETVLGLAIALKKNSAVLELKGIADQFLQELGLVDYFFRDLAMNLQFLNSEQSLRIESGDHQVLGYLGLVRPELTANTAIAEFYLDKILKLVIEEKEYRPLPKYPSVMRDISFVVDSAVRVGPIQDLLENSSHLLEDVDLLDWYEDEKLGDNKKSLTFRLVFQSSDRTLTDEEVGKEMEKIIAGLQEKFDLEIR